MAAHVNPIPVIDFENSTPSLASAIGDAVSSVGFLHVRGFKVTQAQVNRMFEISRELSASPIEERLACKSDGRNGWSSFGAERLDESKGRGDLKENFAYGRFSAPHTETVQPLPSVLQKYKKEMDDFHKDSYDGTCDLLDAFSVALGLPKTYFRDRHTPGVCSLTLLHYPAIPPSEVAETVGLARASAHKDWGSVTLLFQEENGTPGLEINYKGDWYTAPIIPNTVLVNIGLALELWTGGTFTATLHRVVPQASPDGGYRARRSIAYFVQPSDDVILNTISKDGSIDKGGNAVTSGEFFQERLRLTVLSRRPLTENVQ